MNPRVQKVKPLDDFKLLIVFENGEERIFDVTPFLDKGIFTELRALNMLAVFNDRIDSIFLQI
ncbi:MAG: DUF2442 domain-containing protein [Draconibacterium sp.]|nr:DUF2442 domain-containing protein [Draconibacterium sp.]